MKKDWMLPRGLAIVALWALAPGIAAAYIDPGNGAYMVQALFTIAGAALFYLRHPIRSIRAVLGKFSGHRQQDQRSEAEHAPELSPGHPQEPDRPVP